MLRIGNIWDSTTQVLAGRAGLLLPIAALAFFLPAALQAALAAYSAKTLAASAAGLLLSIVALVATIWGQLAVIAVASDPATTRGAASSAATNRLPAALLVTLVILAASFLVALPIGVVLAASGFDFNAAAGRAGSAGAPTIGVGPALFLFLYGLVVAVVGLWLGARLFLLNAVILNERRGIGALGRSFQLTRGLALRLIGVLLLFLVVLLVSSIAARSVVFIIVRLLLGLPNIATATFMGALAAAAVTAAFSTVAAVFAARLYAAARDHNAGISISK